MSSEVSARGEGAFYVLFAGLALVAVVVGFAPTYYLQPYYGTPALTVLLHLHGALFSSWLLLLVAQTAFVKSGQLALHRRLGWFGVVIAAAMVVLGTYLTLVRSPLHANPTFFYITGFGDMIMFAAFVGAAVTMRRQTEVHRRLMVLGTIALLNAGVGRWTVVTPLFEQHRTQYAIETELLTDAFLLLAVIFDWLRRGRVHPVYVWGGSAWIVSQIVRIAIDF